MKKSSHNYKTELLEIINKHIPECKVWVFGSRARGDNQEGADVDLLLDAGHKIDQAILRMIRGAIEDSDIPVFVDVVDNRDIENSFRDEIAKDLVQWKN